MKTFQIPNFSFPVPSSAFQVSAFVFFVLFVVPPAFAKGERELVSVLAARVRWGLSKRLEMPDQPPNLILNNVRSADRSELPSSGERTGISDPLRETSTPVERSFVPSSQTPTPLPDNVLQLIDGQPQEIADLEAATKEAHERNELLEQSLEKLTRELMELKAKQITSPAAGPSNRTLGLTPTDGELSPGQPPLISPRGSLFGPVPDEPLSLTLHKPVSALADTEPVYRVTMFTGEDHYGRGWCVNCLPVKGRFGTGIPGLEIEYSSAIAPGPQIYPAWRWKHLDPQRGATWRCPTDRNGKYLQPDTPQQLLEWIDYDEPIQPQNESAKYSASGVGGAIRTNGTIRTLLEAWKSHLGPDAAVSFRWDRTGVQTMSVTKLIAGQPWTPLMIAGRFGHVDLRTTSTMLPVQDLGFAYKTLDNGRFSIDMDAVVVGLPNNAANGTYGSHETYGSGDAYWAVDPISIGFYAYSFATALYQILNPQVDVGLGGCVAAAAKLDGPDKLIVTFSECPSIHVAVWFKFDLEVQRLVITPGNVHVEFKPQPKNWIRIDSRDFAVEDH